MNGVNRCPAIVLVNPQLGENIGIAARAMGNFDLNDLRLVAPRDGWPNEMARKSASGANGVIDNARLFPSVEDAIGDAQFVVATTARRRDMIKPVMTPASAARELSSRIQGGERVCILFGAERSGLDNDAVALSDAIIMAPVNPAFASLNLGQAVLLVAYEWFSLKSDGTLGRETVDEPARREGLELRHTRTATKSEYLGLFEHLERELDDVGFLLPAEKRPAMVRNLRNLLQRQQLTEQDIRTLRGVVSSLSRAHMRSPDAGSS